MTPFMTCLIDCCFRLQHSIKALKMIWGPNYQPMWIIPQGSLWPDWHSGSPWPQKPGGWSGVVARDGPGLITAPVAVPAGDSSSLIITLSLCIGGLASLLFLLWCFALIMKSAPPRR